jgi:hypothetical protein
MKSVNSSQSIRAIAQKLAAGNARFSGSDGFQTGVPSGAPKVENARSTPKKPGPPTPPSRQGPKGPKIGQRRASNARYLPTNPEPRASGPALAKPKATTRVSGRGPRRGGPINQGPGLRSPAPGTPSRNTRVSHPNRGKRK